MITRRSRGGALAFVWDDDKPHPSGRWTCRREGCQEPARHPFRYYCSAEHRSEFQAWLESQAPPHWSVLRDRILLRDGFTCVLCGAKPVVERYDYGGFRFLERIEGGNGVVLEVDHIKPVALHPELEFEPSNLRTLCHECHVRHGARPQSRIWRARNHPDQATLAAEARHG